MLKHSNTWTPELDEIIRAHARKGTKERIAMVEMLLSHTAACEKMRTITGSDGWLLNPAFLVCPIDGKKCRHGRHATGQPGRLCGLFAEQTGHLCKAHGDNPVAKALIARYTALKHRPKLTAAELDTIEGCKLPELTSLAMSDAGLTNDPKYEPLRALPTRETYKDLFRPLALDQYAAGRLIKYAHSYWRLLRYRQDLRPRLFPPPRVTYYALPSW